MPIIFSDFVTSGVEHGNLEQRGMDRVLSYGPDGYERMVMLSGLSLNVASSA